MIDKHGYRLNVGIILVGPDNRLFWARRHGKNAWQFPQGGMHDNETPQEAMYRELREEIGLLPEDVQLIGRTRGWLYYRLPKNFMRHNTHPLVIGQKQKWFLLRLIGGEEKIRLDLDDKPEFDQWRWVDYWYPLEEVIYFKRSVYKRALKQLEPLLFPPGDVAQREGT